MGAGKSSVIAILQEAGIPVLDCDAINAHLLEKGEDGYRQLVETFGKRLLKEDGTFDKQRMSDLIFADVQKKAQAEALLHPLIQRDIKAALQTYAQKELVVVEVPLLFEVHWESFFDEVWVIACDEELLLQRLVKYRHVSIDEAKRRLAHQMPQEAKIKRADVVLYNNSDKESLRQQICAILKEKNNSEVKL